MGCYSSIVINAPAEKVWGKLRDFHDVSWSKNVISKVDVVGDKASTEVGAKRVLNEAFQETLQSHSDECMELTYSIDDGPPAVSKDNVDGYLGRVRVFSVSEDDSSFVVWTSKWKSAKEDGVADFCNPIYHAVLQDLKLHFS